MAQIVSTHRAAKMSYRGVKPRAKKARDAKPMETLNITERRISYGFDDSEVVDRQVNIAGGGFRVVRKVLEDA